MAENGQQYNSFGILAEEPRWVAWRNERRGPKDKPAKIPYSPHSGKAKADNPSTWRTCAEAEKLLETLEHPHGGGIGYELGDLGGDLHIGGLDLDSCLDEQQICADWAAAIMAIVPTYGEISPSGTGLKLFLCIPNEHVRPFLDLIGVPPEQYGCRRDAPGKNGQDHGPAIEVYLSHRYFAVTGQRWPECPDRIATLDWETLQRLAGLIPPPLSTIPSLTANGANSRSAKAFRVACRVRAAGGTLEDMLVALENDPETAEWLVDKGDARQLHRLWERSALAEAKHRWGEAYTISAGKTPPDVLIESAGNRAIEKIDWLWPGWLARRKFHILAGAKAAGKSTVIIDLMARITAGSTWPDGTPAPTGNVIIWSGEDDIDDTILPRFVAAGGIKSRLFPIEHTREGEHIRSFDPSTDMERLLDAAANLPDLLFLGIAPVVLALPVRSDSHKNAETRRGLQPLVNFAKRRGVALLGITHFTKGTQDRDPVERLNGSLAFGALPRVIWDASADDDGQQRRLVRIISNIGGSGGGIEYTLYQALIRDHDDFFAQRVDWGPQLNGPARELLNAIKQSALAEATAFLKEFLRDGAKPQKDIKDAAEAHGHSWATIRRAQKKLGIKPKQEDRAWYWELPEQPTGYEPE
jgi:hypothetical protein